MDASAGADALAPSITSPAGLKVCNARRCDRSHEREKVRAVVIASPERSAGRWGAVARSGCSKPNHPAGEHSLGRINGLHGFQ